MNGTMKRETLRTSMKANMKSKMKGYADFETERFDALQAENLTMGDGSDAGELVAPDCNVSVYSMAAMAGGLLMCLGILIYAFLTH